MPPEYRTYVASDPDARVLREYDLSTGEYLRTVAGPDDFGEKFQPSSDGTRLAAGTRAGCRVVTVADGRVIFAPPADARECGFAYGGDGRRLAVMLRNPVTEGREGDRDMEGVYINAVVIYDLDGRAEPRVLRPLLNYNLHGRFSPDGRLFAVTGEWEPEEDDQAPPFSGAVPVQVWDAATGEEVARLPTPEALRDVSFDFMPDGRECHLGSEEGTVPGGLYEMATGTPLCEYQADWSRDRGRYVLSPDGLTVVGLLESSSAVVRRNVRTGAVIDVTASPFGKLDAFLPDVGVRADGAAIILQVVNQAVHGWVAPPGRPLTRLVGGSVPISAITFADDGREIRTAGREGIVRRWGARTGELLAEISLPEAVAGRMALVAFGPADWALARSRDGTALFNLVTGEIRLTPREHAEAIQSQTLTPDGWLADLPTHFMGESDSGVRLRHLLAGDDRVIARFTGDSAAVAYGRGILLLMYDDRDKLGRTIASYRVTGDGAAEAWSRRLPIGPEFKRPYGMTPRFDHHKVAFDYPRSAILWSPDGASALALPRRECVPFLVDSVTGATLSEWSTAIVGPHAVHPHRSMVATATSGGADLIVADWRTGAVRAEVRRGCYPHALAWSPDGSRLAAAGPDGTAWVFDLISV